MNSIKQPDKHTIEIVQDMSVKEEHFPIKLKDSIILRPYTRADASIIFHTVNENREHLRRWFPWVKATQKVEDSLEFLITIVEDEQQKGTGIHLGIFDISIEEEKLLGAVAIRNINLSNHSGELGCWLSQESQGKGLATVACLKIIDYGKIVLGIERFELHTAVDNHRTQALAERLGFQRLPGVIKSAEVIDSTPVDHIVYIFNDQ